MPQALPLPYLVYVTQGGPFLAEAFWSGESDRFFVV